jgi:hypothetical protein
MLVARESSESREDAVAAMILLYQFMKENSQRGV